MQEICEKKRVFVVMPAYNAEKTLKQTIEDIPRDIVDTIILVDDCSRDNTAKLAEELGLDFFVHEKNMGYGANQKTCYKLALERGADIVVMLHPDYQYDPTYIPYMVEPIRNGHFDIMLGSRITSRREVSGRRDACLQIYFQSLSDPHGKYCFGLEPVRISHGIQGIFSQCPRNFAIRREQR